MSLLHKQNSFFLQVVVSPLQRQNYDAKALNIYAIQKKINYIICTCPHDHETNFSKAAIKFIHTERGERKND